MSNILSFAILGLASGALYILISLGLVIIHRVSRIVNYAQGAIGMVGTFVFWDLNQNHHVSYAAALLAGLAVSGAIGLLTYLLIMRPLANAALLTRMISTLGLLTVLEQAVSRIFQQSTINVPSELPTSTVSIFGAAVGWNQIIIIGISLVVTLLVALLYQATQFGRLTAAAAENARSLALLGHSAHRIAAANWAISGVLAGGAGILLAPMTGLDVTQFTLLVLPALAGAVVGRLTSFPLTVVGGLVIGIAQSEMSRYVSAPGWSSAAPFILIVILLVVRGRDENLRSAAAQRLPLIGTGRVRLTVAVPLVVAVVAIITALSPTWNDAVITTLTSAIILLSLIVVTGYSGQLSLAQFAFAGWGAWVAGRLAASTGLAFPWALLIGVAATLPLGLVLGLVCLRTRGINLSIVTLAFAVAVEQIVFDNPSYTGGLNGTNVGLPHLFGLDVNAVTLTNRYALVCLAVFVICALGIANLRRGRSGRRLLAVRANERAVASLGVNVVGAKLYAFCLASVLASAGGILMAFANPAIIYTTFGSLTSIQLVPQAVVGGIGWLAGAPIGALLTVGSLGTQVLDLLGQNVAVYLPLIGGVLLLITVIAAPDGLAYNNWLQFQAVKRLLLRRVPARPARTPRPGGPLPGPSGQETGPSGPVTPGFVRRVNPATLVIDGIGVRFGGVRALDGPSLRVGPGEVVGLIGPNGAGKSTLIDAVTGFVRATGRVTLDGRDISGWAPAKRSRAGLARSFQSLELFDDMSVLDNLRVASERHRWWAYLQDLVFPRTPALSSVAEMAIAEFGLQPHLAQRPSDLSYGQRRLVAIARAIATQPSILLLDEPAAGLDDGETRELGALIRSLAEGWGMGILLIEHDVELVMTVCDRICAIDFGRQIAEGTPAELRQSPAVIAAYLGMPEAGESGPPTADVSRAASDE
jgi:sulfate-transporting ATPase